MARECSVRSDLAKEMNSFIGKYLNKFDEAGRVSLPAKMRDELRQNNPNDTLVIFFAPHTKCLKLMPKNDFDQMMQKASSEIGVNKVKMASFRILASSAYHLEINSSGRISIPATLRQAANLQEECYINGAMSCIEIWNKELWEAQEKDFLNIDIDSLSTEDMIDPLIY